MANTLLISPPMTAFVDILRPQIAAANSVGSDFVVGEC